MIKAKDTVYNGYRFRSRLEARHDVFYDVGEIEARYEEQDYILPNGIRYLPDFKLLRQDCFVEVKGIHPTRTEQEKAVLLSLIENKPVHIFYGNIWIPGIDDTYIRYYDDDKLYGEVCKKTADTYDPSAATLIGEDTLSSCNPLCSYDCSHMQEIQNDESYGCLVRAVYIANIRYSDSCKLRICTRPACLGSNALEFLIPTYEDAGQHRYKGRVPIPLPDPIKEYEQEFISLLSHWPDTWEWGIGTCGGVLVPDESRWHECVSCGRLDILSVNYRKPDCQCGTNFWIDDSPRLIAAYTAARQTRFEHGEKS